jgi:pimeloyl-ACP methyl ester carboxylesterase
MITPMRQRRRFSDDDRMQTNNSSITHSSGIHPSGTHSSGTHGPRRARHLFVTAIIGGLAGIVGTGPHPTQAAAPNPVLLVHGISITGGHDCSDYFADLAAHLSPGRDVFTVGYYADNTGCDFQVAGATNNDQWTSINTLGDEFAVFLNDEFAGQDVDIVAHSMGGLVVRDALDDQGDELRVDNVVTIGTPHSGASAANLASLIGCATMTQCVEMTSGSGFLNGLEHNPQSDVPTKWTLIASDNDEVIGPGTGTAMNRNGNSRPSVAKHTYPTTARRDNNCTGFAPTINHSGLLDTGAVGRCTWSWGQATYTSLTRPENRVRNAIS